MMEVRTPRMLAAPRAGRSGRGRGFGLRRLPPRVARAHDAVYSWICKPILAAGQAPGHRLHQLAPMAHPVQHQGLVPSEDRLPGDRHALWGGSRKSAGNCPSARARQHPRWREVCPRMSSHWLLLSDTLADATRLLEAAPRLPPVTAEPANRRFERPQARRCHVGRKHGRDL